MAGSPGGQISATAQSVRYGTLTGAYVSYYFGVDAPVTAATPYWIVLKQSAAPVGGDIHIDSAAAGDALHSWAPDGLAWTNENAKTLYFLTRAQTVTGISSFSRNLYGVYGSSTNSIGVYGESANSTGVFGSSTNNFGVSGNSVNRCRLPGCRTVRVRARKARRPCRRDLPGPMTATS